MCPSFQSTFLRVSICFGWTTKKWVSKTASGQVIWHFFTSDYWLLQIFKHCLPSCSIEKCESAFWRQLHPSVNVLLFCGTSTSSFGKAHFCQSVSLKRTIINLACSLFLVWAVLSIKEWKNESKLQRWEKSLLKWSSSLRASVHSAHLSTGGQKSAGAISRAMANKWTKSLQTSKHWGSSCSTV